MRLNRTVAPSRRPWWRVTSIVTGGLATLVAAGWASGCSVIYDLSTAQCSSNADCDARGGVFQGLECIENVCQTPTSGCNDNAQCIDEQGAGTDPYICRDRECIPLLTTECPTILPQIDEAWRENLRSPNPLILAGTGLIGGSTNYDLFVKNYDLALTEVNRKVGGLQGGTRPLVMIACQATFTSDEQLDRMMTHLADTVKVPGIVSAMSADNLQRAFNEKGKAANMFFMSPLESDPTLSSMMNNGLLWYIGPSPGAIARAYAPLLTRTLAHLTTAGALTGAARVATVVSSDERFASNTIETIRSSPTAYGIAFNGGNSVFQNTETGNYLGLSITSSDTSNVAEVQSLLNFKPHVIISAATDAFLENVLPALESGWNAAAGGQARPFYILSPLNYNSPVLSDLLENNPTWASRMVGVNGAAAADRNNYESYTVSWDTEFPDDMGLEGYENFYDAAYYLIYAAAGAGQFLTNDGQDFRRGMTRLLQGIPINVGAAGVPAGFQALATPSATIQLNGTLGPPNFNPLDGTRQSDGSVWCIDTTGLSRADVLRYAAGATPAEATLTGTFPTECIPGF
jgi:hypothetical protein